MTPRPWLPVERSQRTSRRLSPGSLEGRSEQAQRVPSRAKAATVRRAQQDLEVAPFSSIGDLIVATSGPYEVIVGGRSLVCVANLSAALTGTTTILVKVNGATATTITIASGATRGTATVTLTTAPEDLITVVSTVVGTGSALATVQVHIRG